MNPKQEILVRIAAALIVAVALATPALARNEAKELANRKVVLEFYEAGLNRMDFAAASKHLGKNYVQHNPRAADGVEGFRTFLEARKAQTPNARSEIKRAFTDGDFVILHVHSIREPGTPGNAIMDIFRLQNGKIVEHWDVVQPIPEQSANGNGMF